MMKSFLLAVCALATFALPLARAERVTRAEYVKRLDSCEAILREFQSNPDTAIPEQLLRRAHAIVIVNQFKAGFIIGVKDGYGVLLLKRKDGTWSVPAFLKASEASIGFQAGGRAVETVLVFTEDQSPRLLFTQKFNVGADAEAIVGPKAADVEKTSNQLRKNPVLVYTKSRGLYAGATVRTGYLTRDDEANHQFYETPYALPEIVDSDWITPPPDVANLVGFVTKITR